jgi:hypothetical protein
VDLPGGLWPTLSFRGKIRRVSPSHSLSPHRPSICLQATSAHWAHSGRTIRGIEQQEEPIHRGIEQFGFQAFSQPPLVARPGQAALPPSGPRLARAAVPTFACSRLPACLRPRLPTSRCSATQAGLAACPFFLNNPMYVSHCLLCYVMVCIFRIVYCVM